MRISVYEYIITCVNEYAIYGVQVLKPKKSISYM